MSTNEASTDSQQNSPPNVRPYQQEEVLRDLYIEQDFTQQEIADHFNVAIGTINDWLQTYDIQKDRRSINTSTLEYGYVQYFHGSEFIAYQHQIEALRHSLVLRVFREETECHHRLGSPVKIDVIGNLDVLEDDEHTADHADGTAKLDPDELIPSLFGESDDALSWNLSDGAPNHCLNSDDQGSDRQ